MANGTQILRKRSLSCKLQFRKKPALNYLPHHWTACLYCASAIWASPYKEFLESYLIQWDWGFPHPVWVVQLYLHQHLHQSIRVLISDQLGQCLWTNQTTRFWSLIYMKIDQLKMWEGERERERNFCLFKPALAWRARFPFRQNTEDCFRGWAETPRCLLGAELSGAEKNRA